MSTALHEAMLARLLASTPPGGTIDIDALAALIEPLGLDYEATGELIDALERAGRIVGSSEPPRVREELRAVLDAGRALRAELGRAPRPAEIAARSGLALVVVWRALRFGQIVGR